MLPTTRRGNGGWTPWSEMLSLRRDMQDLLETFGGYGRTGEGTVVWAPPMNVHEDGENIFVEVELPGVAADDVDISVNDGVLSITGEKRAAQERTEDNWHVVERRYGRFERSLTLGRTVDLDRISADFEQGVLRITLPKREEARPRRIRVGESAGRELQEGARSDG